MIVLDTNVLSELLRHSPSASVVAWLKRWPRTSLFTTSITQAEIMFGIRCIAPGRRRDALHAAVSQMLEVDFSGRVLNFDSDAAEAYATLASHRRSLGRPLAVPDGMIAGITRSRGAKIATRNLRDFEDVGLDILDPWQPSRP